MKVLRTFVAFLFMLALGLGQAFPSQIEPQRSSAESSSQRTATDEKKAKQPEHHISREEAEELFRAVDEILEFNSKRTGLPIKHPVKRKLTSRVEVEKFFVNAFKEDESAKRLQQAELVLKKFGLIPRDSSLQGTLLALYTESVAGYYDPKTKTVYLLDWLDADSQKPVLAHELTHALQDQNFDLQKFFKIQKNKSDRYDVTTSEAQSARVAVMEGQAAAVMVDYLLADRGLTLTSAPDVARAVQAAMLAEPEAPILAHAPLYLREDLKFPYTYGLNFVLELLNRSPQLAFDGAFRNPPASTRQIMDPETYLKNESVPALPMPDFQRVLGSEWQQFDVDVVGQFDISILAREYGRTAQQARQISSEWRNSYYYAATKRGTKPKRPEDIALLYVSRWSSPEAANHFADIYSGALGTRYKHIVPVPKEPGHWQSEDGDIFIERQGEYVLITEGFDSPTSKKLREAAFAVLSGASLAAQKR